MLQTIVAPFFVAKILGQLVAHHQVSTSYIWLTALSLFFGATMWYLADTYGSKPTALQIIRDIHTKSFDVLLNQEYDFFNDNFGGSLVSQANRFAKAFELFHNTLFLDMIGQLWSVVIALAIMFYYSVPIGLAVLVCWLGSVGIVIYLAIRRMPVRRRAVAEETRQTGELADSVTNAVTVKTFSGKKYEAKRYSLTNTARMKLFDRSWTVGVRNHYAVQLLCGLLQVIVVVGGIRAVQSGSVSLPIFLLFEVYVLRIVDSIAKTSLFVRQFEGLLGDAHEMTELLMREAKVKDPDHPVALKVTKGSVEFKDVCFDYGGQSNTLFNSLNLMITPGEKVGLVGPSGGGKTTITKLLLRFMDLRSGEILIDGQAIADVRQDDLRSAIAYVPQDTLMFHRSIRENIRYSKPGSSDEEVVAAAKKANAHDFIETLPHGYDTLVGERGIKLSGGQRQRVAIARAILKDAPILILDEATSSLDSESEVLIQAALKELMMDKTTIVIAHRLSTIQRMDRIVVLDKGTIVEEGSHTDLLKNKATYARLWAHQSGGFLED
ncbi:MAG: transporter-related protein [Candidatus Saccharibacteria bacterium]|nr:transporter-related protein [Candidatus Saccharibacteria bacterium]